MRTFAVGDIHGAHKALVQVLDRAQFNPDTDRLISLGDVADGWPEVHRCVDTLLAIPNLIAIRGNHDLWLQEYLEFGKAESIWLDQGGLASVQAYHQVDRSLWGRHRAFFRDQVDYFVDEHNRCYVHGGYDPELLFETQKLLSSSFYWNRSLWRNATSPKEIQVNDRNDFSAVFIGHTNTYTDFPDWKPVNRGKVWNLDQGVKRGGPLTMMDVATFEYVQSDPAAELYAEE